MLVTLLIFLSSVTAQSTQTTQSTQYEMARYRVDPKHRAELVDLLLRQSEIIVAAGDPAPIVIEQRASTWSVIVVTPIGSISQFFSEHRIARWDAAAGRRGVKRAELMARLARITQAKEEEYLDGPSVVEVETVAISHPVVDIELFRAKAGFQDSLAPERDKINRYRARVARPQSLLFRKVSGAQWDLVCLTFYRDAVQQRASIDRSSAEIDAAARASGFVGAKDIDPALTRMIAELETTEGRVQTKVMASISP
jgi:hypothetical protein